ncbi:hypothetical protein SKAU_G00064490 [Synaphobranchus kaupii]|uniref:CCHC-type domain-containing protein n=1 Tax=Synaphobranchus kaupii TaxID=118154 RepID=A0A9Q1J8X5_SYNKA|nr:hypothetical protein SKAU_G00064490 [Synaphobranchus kaupii]
MVTRQPKRCSRFARGGTVSDYAIYFRTLATTTSWNQEAQYDTFFHGLANDIKDELVTHELPASLDALIEVAIRIDRHLSRGRERLVKRDPLHREAETTFRSSVPPPLEPPPLLNDPEPMQIDCTHLTPTERQCRIKSRSCLYCGDPNHFIANCPIKSQRSPIARRLQVSITPLQQSPNTHSLLSASLLLDSRFQVVSVLMESGADGNFMDAELVSQVHLTSVPIQNPLEALAITGAHWSVLDMSPLR